MCSGYHCGLAARRSLLHSSPYPAGSSPVPQGSPLRETNMMINEFIYTELICVWFCRSHPTSCCSVAEIMSVLFFHTMKYRPEDPRHSSNDRFILSKVTHVHQRHQKGIGSFLKIDVGVWDLCEITITRGDGWPFCFLRVTRLPCCTPCGRRLATWRRMSSSTSARLTPSWRVILCRYADIQSSELFKSHLFLAALKHLTDLQIICQILFGSIWTGREDQYTQSVHPRLCSPLLRAAAAVAAFSSCVCLRYRSVRGVFCMCTITEAAVRGCGHWISGSGAWGRLRNGLHWKVLW